MHIRAALRAGVSPNDLAEVFLHTAVYAACQQHRAFSSARMLLQTQSLTEHDTP